MAAMAILRDPYFGVGAWHTDLAQLIDDEVLGYLDHGRRLETTEATRTSASLAQ
jgi:hypothetical protein